MAIAYEPVTWERYHELTRTLASTILKNGSNPEEIIAISRGGLTLGHLLSDLLRLPISTFTIQSYTDIRTQGELTISEPLSKPIEGKRILLVDDVADSGTTLNRATEYLHQFKPLDVTVATLFYKPRSVHKPRYYAQTTSKWILFPYEPTEMILAITTSMNKDGHSRDQIVDFLHQLGYSDGDIRFVEVFHTAKTA